MSTPPNPTRTPAPRPTRPAGETRNTRAARTPRLDRRTLLIAIVLAVLGAAVLLVSGGVAYSTSRQFASQWSGAGGFIGPSIITGTPRLNAEGTPLPPIPGDLGEAGIPAATLTPWDRSGRVTVLLLGLDFRDWENQTEASRSDTMILVTLDPETKTAGMLSIPRDLWVSIPGFKHGKINTAYYLGDAYKLPGGGPALAVKTVENFLGVPINYYAQVDFSAFVRFVDEIGGVTVDVPAPIKIDLLGDGPRTIKNLKAGRQVLPGDYALAYARNRKTENGDFDRAFRQQQVIMGIRNRIVSFDMLPSLIAKAPQLYGELAAGIRTNLTLDEVIQLALLAQSVPEENIKKGIIDKDMVAFGFSPDGLSILVPYPDDVQNLRDSIFAANSSLGPRTPGSAQQQMQAEAARVLIYNGSSDPNLGNRAAEFLRSQGMNVVQVAAADKSYASSAITDHAGSPYALRYLFDLLRITPARLTFQLDLNAAGDIALYLGDDALRNNVFP